MVKDCHEHGAKGGRWGRNRAEGKAQEGKGLMMTMTRLVVVVMKHLPLSSSLRLCMAESVLLQMEGNPSADRG
jgi:hypothetical protein